MFNRDVTAVSCEARIAQSNVHRKVVRRQDAPCTCIQVEQATCERHAGHRSSETLTCMDAPLVCTNNFTQKFGPVSQPGQLRFPLRSGQVSFTRRDFQNPLVGIIFNGGGPGVLHVLDQWSDGQWTTIPALFPCFVFRLTSF